MNENVFTSPPSPLSAHGEREMDSPYPTCKEGEMEKPLSFGEGLG
jgi:hypothetical protein